MSTPVTFGRYRVVGELGRGAMGVVYRGFDPSLDRPVAVKVIRIDEKTADLPIAEMETRFLREAKVAARISHPNVVTVFDAGREGQLLYLVMELVEGQSLHDRMRAGRFPEQPEALELAAQVADALAAAHALGVVHRDIKPANILLAADGKVKVSDFGVAKAMGDETGLTRTGTVVGSPAYMAPEQIRGQQIDGRADVFSIGVILYELLLHRRPFPADTLTTLIFQILHEDPFADASTTATVGPGIAALLQRALAKDPAERLADAASFAGRARELATAARSASSSQAVVAPVPRAEAKPYPPPPPAEEPGAADAEAGELEEGESTAPTRMMETPEFPDEEVIAAPPPGPPARRTPWLTPILLSAAVLALVVAAVFVLRSGQRRPSSDVATALLGERTPIPTAAVAIRMAGTPAARSSDVTVHEEPTTWPTVTPRPSRPEIVMVAPTPRPTRTPIPPPTAVPPTFPPVVATFRCQKGAEFNVSPEDATVEVQGRVIGIADDWDGKGGGETYMFPGPGVFYVKLSMIGYPTKWIRIIVDPSAEDEIADVDTDLE